MRKPITIFLFFVTLIGVNCNTFKDEQINGGVLKSIFLPEIAKVGSLENLECTFDSVVMKSNALYSFDSLMLNIDFVLKNIDTLNTNIETKQYIKVLLLAEWVHALFNYQFLGNLGGSSTNISIPNWGTKSIKECLAAGNSCSHSIWCGDRNVFYLKLLKKMVGVDGYIVSINNIHTYPIVFLKAGVYIIDSYNPFIVFGENNRVVNFSSIVNRVSNYTILRTKRSFGFPSYLISNNLVNQINNYSVNNFPIEKKLELFIKGNKESFLKQVDRCSYEIFNKKGILRKTHCETNPYVIQLIDNRISKPLSLTRFKKYYLGINCK